MLQLSIPKCLFYCFVYLKIKWLLIAYFSPDRHIEHFNSFIKNLTNYPIYNCVIDELSDKIIFTDASSALSGTSYSAILGQVISYKKNKKYVPPYLYLDDKVHQTISYIIYFFTIIFNW